MAIKSLLFQNKVPDVKINYLDIDYDPRTPEASQGLTKTRSPVLRGQYAILNAYRLWLQSRRNDYVRAPEFGGIFDANLNDVAQFRPENSQVVEDYIVNKSNQNWPQIEILSIDVKAIVSERRWRIHLIILDKGSGLMMEDELSREI